MTNVKCVVKSASSPVVFCRRRKGSPYVTQPTLSVSNWSGLALVRCMNWSLPIAASPSVFKLVSLC